MGKISKAKRLKTEKLLLVELIGRIASNIYRLRVRKGWTQNEAAQYCGMDIRMYQRVEGAEGSISLTSIARLCSGFGVDALRLLKP